MDSNNVNHISRKAIWMTVFQIASAIAILVILFLCVYLNERLTRIILIGGVSVVVSTLMIRHFVLTIYNSNKKALEDELNSVQNNER